MTRFELTDRQRGFRDLAVRAWCIAGDLLLVLDEERLRVFDVVDLDAPLLLGELGVTGNALDCDMDRAVVANWDSYDAGLYDVSLAQPNAPVIANASDVYPAAVRLLGRYVYANEFLALAAIDLEAPDDDPVYAPGFELLGFATPLRVGDTLLVPIADNLARIDISQAMAPGDIELEPVEGLEAGGFLSGDTLCAGDLVGLSVADRTTFELRELRPAAGPVRGGNWLSVLGTGFAPSDTVQFDGAAVPTQYVSESVLTALVPERPSDELATADVTVQSGERQSAVELYTYDPGQTIVVRSYFPTEGPIETDDLLIEFYGSGMQRIDRVMLGGVDATIDPAASDAYRLVVTAPRRSAPTVVDIVLSEGADERATFADGFTYTAKVTTEPVTDSTRGLLASNGRFVAYVGSRESRTVRLFETADDGTLTETADPVAAGSSVRALAFHGSRLFVLTGSLCSAYDVQQDGQPVAAGSIAVSGADVIFARGGRLYLAGSSLFRIHDASDLALLGELSDGFGFAYGDVRGGLLVANGYENLPQYGPSGTRLRVFDVAHPQSIAFLGASEAWSDAGRVWLGDRVYEMASVNTAWDWSDVTAPAEPTNFGDNHGGGFAMVAERLWTRATSASLQEFDLSDLLAAPTIHPMPYEFTEFLHFGDFVVLDHGPSTVQLRPVSATELLAVAPAEAAESETVRLSGVRLDRADEVRLDADDVTDLCTLVDPSTIDCVLPAEPAGPEHELSAYRDGVGVGAVGLTYDREVAVFAAFGSGPWTGGGDCLVVGRNLHTDLEVEFDGVPAEAMHQLLDSGHLLVTAPASGRLIGTVDVTIRDGAVELASIADGFRYTPLEIALGEPLADDLHAELVDGVAFGPGGLLWVGYRAADPTVAVARSLDVTDPAAPVERDLIAWDDSSTQLASRPVVHHGEVWIDARRLSRAEWVGTHWDTDVFGSVAPPNGWSVYWDQLVGRSRDDMKLTHLNLTPSVETRQGSQGGNLRASDRVGSAVLYAHDEYQGSGLLGWDIHHGELPVAPLPDGHWIEGTGGIVVYGDRAYVTGDSDDGPVLAVDDRAPLFATPPTAPLYLDPPLALPDESGNDLVMDGAYLYVPLKDRTARAYQVVDGADLPEPAPERDIDLGLDPVVDIAKQGRELYVVQYGTPKVFVFPLPAGEQLTVAGAVPGLAAENDIVSVTGGGFDGDAEVRLDYGSRVEPLLPESVRVTDAMSLMFAMPACTAAEVATVQVRNPVPGADWVGDVTVECVE